MHIHSIYNKINSHTPHPPISSLKHSPDKLQHPPISTTLLPHSGYLQSVLEDAVKWEGRAAMFPVLGSMAVQAVPRHLRGY